MNTLMSISRKKYEINISTWVNFVVVPVPVSRFLSDHDKAGMRLSRCKSGCTTQPRSLSSSCSQTRRRSPVGRLFQLLWVWACPNDWQAGSNSCKSGSATRVEPLHLSLWIHICTVHSTNYYKPSVCMCVCLCALKYCEYICSDALF